MDIGDSKALVVKQNGELSAIGHKCTHYGAPLVKGYLGNGRVRCPWHGACFNIKSGDIEEFPGLDSVPCFQVCTLSCPSCLFPVMYTVLSIMPVSSYVHCPSHHACFQVCTLS